MKKISGQLTGPQGVVPGRMPFGITVELTTLLQAENPGGWIGSAVVNIENAGFELFTAYNLGAEEQLSYKVMQGNRVIQAGEVWVGDFSMAIPLSQQSYDDLFIAEATGYLIVRGKVTLGGFDIPAVPKADSLVSMVVHKRGFRASEQLGQSVLDSHGCYELKIPVSEVLQPGTSCGSGRYAAISVTLYAGATPLLQSANVEADSSCTVLDLHVSDAASFHYFLDELSYVSDTLSGTASVPPAGFRDIIIEGSGSELQALSAVTGLDESCIIAVVKAAGIAGDISVSLSLTYALLRCGHSSVYDMAGLGSDQIFEAVSAAAASWLIPAVSSINGLIEALAAQKGKIAGMQRTANQDTLLAVFTAILGAEADALTFLKLSAAYLEPEADALWDAVTQALGAAKAERLQKGMQLLAITGMQPEMTVMLLNKLTAQPVKTLAGLDRATWLLRIAEASQLNGGKICIPKLIQDTHAAEEQAGAYADLLVGAARDLFATAVIAAKIGDDADFALKIPGAVAVKAYLDTHPDFDLRIDNVWDIGDDGSNGSVRSSLMPLQNLMRLTFGEPDAVIALLKDNRKSAVHIAEMAADDFVAAFAAYFKGGEDSAKATYSRALHTSRMNMEARMAMHSSSYLSSVFPMTTPQDQGGAPSMMALPSAPAATPDLQTLFGNMELCSCSECTSMYSPGAYFTDILNFMKKKLGNPSLAFNELSRRRPDLMEIDLTCKNAHTPLPYVDLVNELLEKIILRFYNVPVPASFQTNGTAKELEAYPEHTCKVNGVYQDYTGYRMVYDEKLKEAVYPNNLPFDLPLEESRTYLKHLGMDRYNLLYQFRPDNYVNGSGPVNEFSAQSEWLKIPVSEAEIIVRSHALSNEVYQFFGLTAQPSANTPWYNTLLRGENGEGLGTLLFRSKLAYKDMLQLLTSDFLNPEINIQELNSNSQPVATVCRTFEVWAIDGAAADTCDTTKLYLRYRKADDIQSPPPANKIADAKAFFFDKWHRFLRLQRATGWSVQQLDIVLHSFGITGALVYAPNNVDYTTSDIDSEAFRYIVKTHQLSGYLKQAPEKVCALWSGISKVNYINFGSDSQNKMPSVYDSLFRNKAVMNPPDYHFAPGGTITGNYAAIMATVLAASGLEEDALYALAGYLGINTSQVATLSDLSALYGMALLAKGLKLSVDELLRICRLTGSLVAGPDAYTIFDNLETLLSGIERAGKVAFSQEEVAYLTAHEDEQGIFAPVGADIKAFYTGLRAALQQVDTTPLQGNASPQEQIEHAAKIAALRLNIVRQHFTETFGLDRSIAEQLLGQIMIAVNTAVHPSGFLPASEALLDNGFIASAGDPAPGAANPPLPIDEGNGVFAFSFSQLYQLYRKLDKTSMVISRLKISFEELQSFHEYGPDLGTLAIGDMPVAAPAVPATILEQFLRLNEWIMVRDRLGAGKEAFAALLADASGNTGIADWKDTLRNITRWKEEDITDLLYILDTAYGSVGFRRPGLLLQMADMTATCKVLGVRPATMHALLSSDVAMENSKDIRMAARARYSEEEWAKVAKPLQDVLRERQRQALVAFITGHPGIIITGTGMANNAYRDEQALFAFLLIDVEMKPCMKTSRIKQAIGSAQLFMDRVVLSLENVDGAFGNLISIPADKVEQWESWRKWYRVWEANRKVFLYPENWIEPELRDNKTPFFKELETQLLQDEVKDATAEEAYLAYLERVDEVARLEPVSAYHETDEDTDVLHVFARTQATPHRYFYRKLEEGAWTPWEKMNVDIKGDHMVPVVWNRRLYVFWLSFQKKSMGNEEKITVKSREANTSVRVWQLPSVFRGNDHSWGNMLTKNIGGKTILSDLNDTRYNQWDITLNWSQFKDNKWLPVEMSGDVMTMAVNKLHISDAAEASYAASLQNAQRVFSFLTKNGDVKLDEIFRNRLYLYARPNNYEYGMFFNLLFPMAMNESATGVHTFMWKDQNREPFVLQDDFIPDNMTAPANTRFNKMKFVEDPTGDGKLRIDNLNITPGEQFGYYSYSSDTFYRGFERPLRASSDVLLNNTPLGAFRLTAPANTEDLYRPEVYEAFKDRFFFEDDRNTFFVQKEQGTYAVQQQTIFQLQKGPKIRLDVVQQFAAGKYGKLVLQGSSYQMVKPKQATAYTSGKLYRFHTFYHAQINDFIRKLYTDGLPGLMSLANQKHPDTMNFNGTYQPNLSKVHGAFPANNVQFGFNEAYSIYNWEIFFHAPMLVAQRLSENQQFEEARKWYHYIFNPTSSFDDIQQVTTSHKRRFWKFFPFYEQAQQPVETLYQLLTAINSNVQSAVSQVDQWEKNPFQPHMIARGRLLAYMKNVLMKYLDNLFAWADQLFRRDTIESINEATQLYILAAGLLGKRPEDVPARAAAATRTFSELAPYLDALSNAIVQVESYFAPNGGPLPSSGSKTDHAINVPMFYFCLPKNDKLIGYWDTLADRLFKIRNCMNIDGAVRELPLYEPPIDPALLVRAAAKGISVGALLDSISGNKQSPYRFGYVLQKANEFCNDVKGLGSSLLSAIEKKDAEQLALLRSGQEARLLEQVRYVKEAQVQEAAANLDSIRKTKENTTMRQLYYDSRVFMNGGESQHLSSLQTGMILQAVQGGMMTASSAVAMIPQFHAQATFAIGASFGGQQVASMLNAISAGVGIAAAINSGRGSMALTRAGYERRMDDWQFQASSASKELEQLDRQILAYEIRLDMAKKELLNHELQITHNTETDAYMRNKFSNAELYNWMIAQLSATYFQSYQLAFEMARKAEACFDLELPGAQKPAAGFVGFAYWDSLRKGLLSGEKLQADLRKMESAYMDANRRDLELTRNVSLALTDPKALLQLRKDGSCTFFLPEELYDLDYPGHYQRRIKSVSISLPCITGPYATVAATLTLQQSMVRKTADMNVDPELEAITLRPFIATSGGQNDSGVFELNFRDERYLPFEGRGAVSEWELRLADEDQVRLFDFESISDVIIHVKYTAKDGGAPLRTGRIQAIRSLLETPSGEPALPSLVLPRYFSLKHEFSQEWYAGLHASAAAGSTQLGRPFTLSLNRSMFPAFAAGMDITVESLDCYLKTKDPVPDTPAQPVVYKIICGQEHTLATAADNHVHFSRTISLPASEAPATLSFTLYKMVNNTIVALDAAECADLFIVMNYKLG